MRRATIILAALVVLAAGVAWAGGADPTAGAKGTSWTLTVEDTGVGTSWEVATADTGFTPMQKDTTVAVVFAGHATGTATLHITGLKADSTYYDDVMRVTSATGDTGTVDLRCFESAWLDEEVGTAIVVFSLDGSSATKRLSAIDAGDIWSPVAQRTFGINEDPALTYFSANKTDDVDTVFVALRVYPDINDMRDLSDGYYTIGPWRLTEAAPFVRESLDVGLPPASVLQVWSRASTAGGSVRVTVEGTRGRPSHGWW